MKDVIQLGRRGLRYVRQYGAGKLYRKVTERRRRNKAEAGYPDWLKGQLPGKAQDAEQRKTSFSYAPVISILVPAYETPERFLREMIESVLNQSYEKLELCIADGSPSNKVEGIVKVYEKKDSRIRYRHLTENLGISDNTNAALDLATGEYVGLLDHDDLLLPGALFEIVKAWNEEGQTDVVYTDEDKIDMEGSRHFAPHFKPDFNPEYLRSNNYICHFFVVRRAIALEIDGFQTAFDGAQDHDFILRCTEEADGVLHLPKVLYSWRSHRASTATNPESKLYAYEAGKRAVAAHLKRIGLNGSLKSTDNYGFYRVVYPGAPETLKNSFEKLDRQTGVNVVYYHKVCNISVTISGKEDYVLFLHVQNENVPRVNRDFLTLLKACCDRPTTGMACARVYDRKKRLTTDVRMAGVRDPFSGGMQGLKAGYTGYFHRAVLQQEPEVPTDCFLMRREVLWKLRESGVKGEAAPAELAKALRGLGFHIYYEPWAVMYEG